jgi:hypothetical protein
MRKELPAATSREMISRSSATTSVPRTDDGSILVADWASNKVSFLVVHSPYDTKGSNPATGTLTLGSVHSSAEPRHGRATASSTL